MKIQYLPIFLLFLFSCTTIDKEQYKIADCKEEIEKSTEKEVYDSEYYYNEACNCDIYSEKIELLTKAIEMNSEYGDAFHLRGDTYFFSHEIDIAISDLLIALLLLPEKKKELLNKLGFLYSKLGEFEKSTYYLDLALDSFPNSVFIIDNLAGSYFDSGEYLHALDLWNKALVLKRSSHLLANRGIAYLQIKEYGKVLEDINLALELEPDFGRAYFLRSKCLAFLGKYDESINDLYKAQDEGYNCINFGLGLILFHSGEYLESIKYLLDDLSEDEKLFKQHELTDYEYKESIYETYKLLALSYFSLGDLETAEIYYTKLAKYKSLFLDSVDKILKIGTWSDKESEVFADLYNWYFSEIVAVN